MMNKRVGILTFTHGDNYGQRLQNYAVQEVVRKFGFSPYTLKQHRSVSLLDRSTMLAKDLLRRRRGKIVKRHDAFKSFDDEFIRYFPEEIAPDHIPGDLDGFAAFVAGSDQIWNPRAKASNSTMFLTFAPRKKRIAFAPSIAEPAIPEDRKEEYRRYLSGFDRLSVREESGARIIKELTGQDAAVLIDPTLMFDDAFWGRLCRQPGVATPRRYAFCYLLGGESIDGKAKAVCDEYSLNMLSMLEDPRLFTQGPCEFLWLIKNAELVIADSFHGIVFSILFNVPFLYCNRVGVSDMSSRFDTLFDKLHIRGRGIDECTSEKALHCDYTEARLCLVEERELVESYLSLCFEGLEQP